MARKLTELGVNPDKKFKDVIEASRKAVVPIFPDSIVKFVGWQCHFVVEDKEGNAVLSSIGAYTEGFDLEDYEK